jgi:16S rRNA (cytosine967-C5)-methyltransferase
VRELVYAAIRAAGEVPVNGRAAVLGLNDPPIEATFDGSTHGPAPIDPGEPRAPGGVAPAWLEGALVSSGIAREDHAALVGRAPLDCRVNWLKSNRDAVLAMLPEAEPTPHAPDGIRLPSGTNVEGLPAFRDGLIEVQDEGSQIVGLALPAQPGSRIVDLCAGAGGKSLALAARMNGQGALLACDTDRGRLSRLPARAARAGAAIETQLLNPYRELEALAEWRGAADGVLIDAPCSGTGTWRRNPEARWRLTPDRLERLVETQRHVLNVGAALVRPGGHLVYIVCSLLDDEGTNQVAWFRDAHPGWTVEAPDLPAGRAHGAGWRLDPASDGTDGFFVARLIAPC